jgi:2-oxo-4-hydroxy-4-carboxy-5-ureidoimidazoline decarboxylase
MKIGFPAMAGLLMSLELLMVTTDNSLHASIRWRIIAIMTHALSSDSVVIPLGLQRSGLLFEDGPANENNVLAQWNTLDAKAASSEILSCCGSRAWARNLVHMRPFESPQQIFAAADRVWAKLAERDWQQAFATHPRIGQQQASAATKEAQAWAQHHQPPSAEPEGDVTTLALAEGNRHYEGRFGRIFIVCAQGKIGAEILSILNARMHNTIAMEWFESGEQQRQITHLRLRRWLGANR